jgi:hypothetical protein
MGTCAVRLLARYFKVYFWEKIPIR